MDYEPGIPIQWLLSPGYRKGNWRGAPVAQWVKASAFASGHDPRVLGSSPVSGSLLSREPASLPLSLPASLPTCDLCQINKIFKKNLFIHFREGKRVRAQRGQEEERETLLQTPCWTQCRGGAWVQDPEITTWAELNQPGHPGSPSICFFITDLSHLT